MMIYRPSHFTVPAHLRSHTTWLQAEMTLRMMSSTIAGRRHYDICLTAIYDARAKGHATPIGCHVICHNDDGIYYNAATASQEMSAHYLLFV